MLGSREPADHSGTNSSPWKGKDMINGPQNEKLTKERSGVSGLSSGPAAQGTNVCVLWEVESSKKNCKIVLVPQEFLLWCPSKLEFRIEKKGRCFSALPHP